MRNIRVAAGHRTAAGAAALFVCLLTAWHPAGTADGSPAPDGPASDVYAFIGPDDLDPVLADLTPRVYVPNEDATTVTVIDAETLAIVKDIRVREGPHHVTPGWKMRRLFVNEQDSSSLAKIDPFRVRKVGRLSVPVPYNLYFTPDGTTAMVVAELKDRIVFYDRATWTRLGRLLIPSRGVDHGDFSADGETFVVSTEYGGAVYRIDVDTRQITGEIDLDGQPVDVKLSADGTVFYVADQERHGVSVIDPTTMSELDFLETGQGAHGMAVSRDGDSLYVSNRTDGTIGVIDFATRSIVDTWDVGGSPDMLNVSIDGGQLWASNRFDDDVSVIDTSDGHVITRIATGPGAHGLTYFPQPGRFSIGHNGVYR